LAAGKKIWTSAKLATVLERCLAGNPPPSRPIPTPSATKNTQRSLVRLLESERLHGTTTERDPTQKRHDYTYFSKNSYFVLVEDLKQELAPIAALEYAITKARDGKESESWPVLYCHPQARGPFIEFDEKEKRRWLKAEDAEKERDEEREDRRRKFKDEERERRRQSLKLARAKSRGDLRRTVSMTNLHRQGEMAFEEGDLDLDESAKASGYLASTGGYMAASGNSVGITSTTGNTSTTDGALTTLQLPPALRGRVQQEVVTSRKFATKGKEKGEMGPPAEIPDRRAGLRKSRSTNTMRLPKRDEGSKPGYCESCRQRFNDFKEVRWLKSINSRFQPCCSIPRHANIASLPWTMVITYSWT
jgi:regulatory subunit for Cdc7p protein kinase